MCRYSLGFHVQKLKAVTFKGTSFQVRSHVKILTPCGHCKSVSKNLRGFSRGVVYLSEEIDLRENGLV